MLLVFALLRISAFAAAAYAGFATWPAGLTIAVATAVFAISGLAYGLAVTGRAANHLADLTGRRQRLLPTGWLGLFARNLLIGLALSAVAYVGGTVAYTQLR